MDRKRGSHLPVLPPDGPCGGRLIIRVSEPGNLRALMLGGQFSGTSSSLSPGAWTQSSLPAPSLVLSHPPPSPGRLTAAPSTSSSTPRVHSGIGFLPPDTFGRLEYLDRPVFWGRCQVLERYREKTQKIRLSELSGVCYRAWLGGSFVNKAFGY